MHTEFGIFHRLTNPTAPSRRASVHGEERFGQQRQLRLGDQRRRSDAASTHEHPPIRLHHDRHHCVIRIGCRPHPRTADSQTRPQNDSYSKRTIPLSERRINRPRRLVSTDQILGRKPERPPSTHDLASRAWGQRPDTCRCALPPGRLVRVRSPPHLPSPDPTPGPYARSRPALAKVRFRFRERHPHPPSRLVDHVACRDDTTIVDQHPTTRAAWSTASSATIATTHDWSAG